MNSKPTVICRKCGRNIRYAWSGSREFPYPFVERWKDDTPQGSYVCNLKLMVFSSAESHKPLGYQGDLFNAY